MAAAPLWTMADVAAAVGGDSIGDGPLAGISIDSRSVAMGDLFIALAGPTFDGHDFVADAFANGAAAALVQRADVTGDEALIRVADTMAALEALGRAGRERSRARIAAITGSVGKTGTKEALKAALTASGETHANLASLNNHWGTPLSLARLPATAAYAVFELGMNHAGEIEPLSRMVRPLVALITNVEPVHLAAFDGVDAIADAKAEIFSGLEPGGIAILNRDNSRFERLRRHADAAGAERILSFGVAQDADARLIEVASHPECSCITAEISGQRVIYKIGAPGRHWVLNSLAVLLTVHAMEADLGRAALAMPHVTPPKGRGERHRIALRDGSALLIDESYNANPVAVRAALAVLGQCEPERRGRRIAVLGDMLELGPTAAKLHRDLGPALIENHVDLLFACGPNMEELFRAVPADMRAVHCATSDALAPAVCEALRPGDVIMVKGSLGSAMGPIVDALRAMGEPNGGGGEDFEASVRSAYG